MSSYASPTDLTSFGISAAALAGISGTVQQAALDAASGVADGYLRARYTLPIVTPDTGLKRAVCGIAAYDLLKARGFNPENGADQIIVKGYDDAMRWLRDVSNGVVAPALVDSTPDGTSPAAPLVISDTPRGW